jgi:drug/metabolite transporter (DMT)-like permease
MSPIFYAFVLACIVLTSACQVLMKKGTQDKKKGAGIYLNRFTLSAYAILLLVTVFSVVILRHMELKLFYALMSLNYVTVALFSRFLLNEPFGRNVQMMTLLVVAGVVIYYL